MTVDGEALVAAFLAQPDDETVRFVYADWVQEHVSEAMAQGIRQPVTKQFGTDFDSPGGALTLDPSDVSDVGNAAGYPDGMLVRTHADGWTISGVVHEDYYHWVNEFAASHPVHGLVWGNFEGAVFASSEEAYLHFYGHHTPSAWDYHDI